MEDKKRMGDNAEEQQTYWKRSNMDCVVVAILMTLPSISTFLIVRMKLYLFVNNWLNTLPPQEKEKYTQIMQHVTNKGFQKSEQTYWNTSNKEHQYESTQLTNIQGCSLHKNPNWLFKRKICKTVIQSPINMYTD